MIWDFTVCSACLLRVVEWGNLRHRASNWYWLTVGQGLLCRLQQLRIEVFIWSVSSLSFISRSRLSISFIFSTISSIFFLPFSGRWHEMAHKGWHVIKPQHNQSPNAYGAHWNHLAEAIAVNIYKHCFGTKLTLVLQTSDMPCLCKQCRSRSVWSLLI